MQSDWPKRKQKLLRHRNRFLARVRRRYFRRNQWQPEIRLRSQAIRLVASYADILWDRHAIFLGGRLRDEPKECLRRRLYAWQPGKVSNELNTQKSESFTEFPVKDSLNFSVDSIWCFFRNVERFQRLCAFARWRNARVRVRAYCKIGMCLILYISR